MKATGTAGLALAFALAALGCGERGTQAPAPSAAADAAAPHDAAAHAAHRELPGGEIPQLSLYQLEGSWTSAAGEQLPLASLRGSPVLLLLFYGSCQTACPVLVHDLERVAALLDPSARDEVRFALVTIDPERDTPERLAAYAKEHQLDSPRWTLLHGPPEQVRELAAAVGFRYRPTGDGQFNHTMRILLLDREGAPVEHWDGLTRPVEPIAARASEIAAAQ